MAYQVREIRVSKLLLDQSNARLGVEQDNQQATEEALARLLGGQLLEMAQDIVDSGTDPTALLAVTTEGAPTGRYRVLEGNRRLLALKALDTPTVVEHVMTTAARKKLRQLSVSFRQNPIDSLRCVVFDHEDDEARHWVELRHTGENNGVGLVGWDTNDQDRYRTRHGQGVQRKPAGQIIDFVDLVDPPRDGDVKRIFTTLARIISTKAIRDKLGIEIESGRVYSNYPAREVLKGLRVVVRDLRSGTIKVSNVYHHDQRLDYLKELQVNQLPDPSTRLKARSPLDALDPSVPESVAEGSTASQPAVNGSPAVAPGASAGSGTGHTGGNRRQAASGSPLSGVTTSPSSSPGPAARRSSVKPLRPRMTTIPRTCVLKIKHGRINQIYHELLDLQVDQYTNACSVLLRVFIELSVDEYVIQHTLMTEAERRNSPLAKRLKLVADHLRKAGGIDANLENTIIKIADGQGMLSASTITFNQYVHNGTTFPQPSEVRTSWDELEPFMKAAWA